MSKPTRRHDPERRQRIVEAALEVIAVHGVTGATHRRIAEAAEVPLGSMTYHFDGIDDVVDAAFRHMATVVSGRFSDILEAADSREAARQAVVRLICGDVWASERNLTLSYELYAYAARRPDKRVLPTEWMAASRRALERHFDAATARALDAVIEGVTIHNHFSGSHIPPSEVRRMVDALTAAEGA